jgi:hypothetical protein
MTGDALEMSLVLRVSRRDAEQIRLPGELQHIRQYCRSDPNCTSKKQIIMSPSSSNVLPHALLELITARIGRSISSSEEEALQLILHSRKL